jgi:hypothetical protein
MIEIDDGFICGYDRNEHSQSWSPMWNLILDAHAL